MNKQIFAGLIGVCAIALATGAQATETSSVFVQPLMLLAHAGHDHGATHSAHSNTAAVADAKTSTTVTVSGCWIRSMPSPAPSGGYFVMSNSGSKPVQLQSASSADYGMIMLHQTTQKDGMSRMSATHNIAIPAAGQLEFKPGGYHAMLEKPAKEHAVGSKVVMNFLFDNGEKASAECEVKPANTRTPMAH